MRVCRLKPSSVIEWVGYEDDTASLWIHFRGTGKYVYYEVPVSVFRALCDTSSPGAFFNEHIKDRYRHRRDPARRRFGPVA